MSSRTLPQPIIPTIRSSANSATVIQTSSVQINSTETGFGYPIIKLNTLDAGPGVTSGISGFYAMRGSSPAVQFVWSEANQTFIAGITGNTTKVATISNNVMSQGILRWDGAKFTNTGTTFVNALDQNVSTTSSPEFQDISLAALVVNGNRIVLPTTQGILGTVPVNDGNGNLSWETPATLVMASVSNGSDTSVVTSNNNITIEAGGNITQVSSSAGTNFLKPILAGNISLKTKNINTSYTIGKDDSVIVYIGTTTAVITLPVVISSESRILLIENLSNNIIQIVPSNLNNIDGTSDSIILDSYASSVMIIGDGNSNWITI